MNREDDWIFLGMVMVEICLIWLFWKILMNKLQKNGSEGNLWSLIFFMLLVWRNAFWHLYLYFLPLCFSQICVAFKKVLLIQGFLYNLLYLWIVTCIWWFSLSWSFKFNLLCFASKLCVFSVSIWSHVRNYIFLQFAAAMTMLRLGSVLLWKKLQIFLQLP